MGGQSETGRSWAILIEVKKQSRNISRSTFDDNKLQQKNFRTSIIGRHTECSKRLKKQPWQTIKGAVEIYRIGCG